MNFFWQIVNFLVEIVDHANNMIQLLCINLISRREYSRILLHKAQTLHCVSMFIHSNFLKPFTRHKATAHSTLT